MTMRPAHHLAGQSMVELAVFGSLILFGMAFLLRYGLTYNYQQMTQQEATRLAIARAFAMPCTTTATCQQKQASVILVRDRRMIDPTNPFMAGARQTFLGSGSASMGNTSGVVRTSDATLVPKQQVVLNDPSQPLNFTLADFWATQPVIEQPYVCAVVDLFGEGQVQLFDANNPVRNDSTRLPYHCSSKFAVPTDNNGNPFRIISFALRILDNCMGDIIDPQSCQTQCTKLTTLGGPRSPITPPAYCSKVAGLIGEHYGLNTNQLSQTHQIINDERIGSETQTQHRSESHIDESDTFEREIKISPLAPHPSPLWQGVSVDTDSNGNILDRRVRVEQTMKTKRDETFSTPW